MGCVHADGGNPKYVCDECELDERGFRTAQRAWVRGDVLPEVHGTATGRLSTGAPNLMNAPSTLSHSKEIHRLFTFKMVDPNKLSEYERGRRKGSEQMLESIRGSLRGYPDSGGDIEVMEQVERIEVNARTEAVAVLRRGVQEAVDKVFRSYT